MGELVTVVHYLSWTTMTNTHQNSVILTIMSGTEEQFDFTPIIFLKITSSF